MTASRMESLPDKTDQQETTATEPEQSTFPSSSALSKTNLLANDTSKRRNLGRKARNRRKKLIAIEAVASAAAAAAKNPTTPLQEEEQRQPSQQNNVLPSDRNYVWPAVQELVKLSPEDRQALVAQLGYLPGNAIQVVARVGTVFDKDNNDKNNTSSSSYVSPLVLKLYPLVQRDESDSTNSRRKRKRHKTTDGPVVEPFPTIFWCTNPQIRALISKLELQNWSTKLEQRLKDDSKARAFMQLAHESYGQERRNLITNNDLETIIQPRKWESAFCAKTRGVAGIRNFGSIKCLHAHAAHYWSGCSDNVVGEWVSQQIANLLQEEKSDSNSKSTSNGNKCDSTKSSSAEP